MHDSAVAPDVPQQHAPGQELLPAYLALMVPLFVSRLMGLLVHIQVLLRGERLPADFAWNAGESVPVLLHHVIAEHEVVYETSSAELANEIEFLYMVLDVGLQVLRMAGSVIAERTLLFLIVVDFHVNPQCPLVEKHFITNTARNIPLLLLAVVPTHVPQHVLPLIEGLIADRAHQTLLVYFDMYIVTILALEFFITLTALQVRWFPMLFHMVLVQGKMRGSVFAIVALVFPVIFVNSLRMNPPRHVRREGLWTVIAIYFPVHVRVLQFHVVLQVKPPLEHLVAQVAFHVMFVAVLVQLLR